MSSSTYPTPLAGLRVIEFCHVAAGPYCGMLLADLGADVIKVEPPQGDSLRAWPPHSKGFSENFASLNRNKRSIALNLKEGTERAIARQLINSADVVVENNRPGVMKRLGLDYDSFKESHPTLIYCSIAAFGQTGPRAADGGFDVTLQAVSGVMSVTGEPTGAPVKAGVPITDFASGLYAAFTITSMWHQVKEGKKGGHIDVPMVGASLAVAALQTSEFFGTGKDPEKLGNAHPRNAPYQAFQAKDAHFVLAAGTDALWKSVCSVIKRNDLAEDPRFLTTRDRAANQQELFAILTQAFSSKSVADWLVAFRAKGVPCEPINTYSAALAEEQVEHMGWVQPVELPGGASTKTFGPPVRIDGLNAPIRRPPPALDGDRETILAELKQPHDD